MILDEYIRKKKAKMEWLEFSLFVPFPEVIHAVFLRNGGLSHAPYASLNFGGNVGDDPIAVEKNLKRAKKVLLGYPIFQVEQIHEAEIAFIEEDAPALSKGCDGLISREKRKLLLIRHADCQAALFFDPKLQIIANVHSGWKGLVQNIYSKVVEKFVALGSNPSDLIVAIGPSLGPDHAEFKNYEKEFPPSFWPYQIGPYHFDLIAIAHRELLDCGVQDGKIEATTLCTACLEKDFFSYRRDKITGRNGTFIALKS